MFKRLFMIVLLIILIMPAVYSMENNETQNNVLESNDYYFNASNVENGDGTLQNPYKNLDKNVKAYSVNHIANGQYTLNEIIISDVTLIGEDSTKTVIDCGRIVLNNTKNLKLENITLVDFTIINKGELTCQNTIFKDGYGFINDKYGNSNGGAIYTHYNSSKIIL